MQMKNDRIPYSEAKARELLDKLIWRTYQRDRRSEAMKSIINAMAYIGIVALLKYIFTG